MLAPGHCRSSVTLPGHDGLARGQRRPVTSGRRGALPSRPRADLSNESLPPGDDGGVQCLSAGAVTPPPSDAVFPVSPCNDQYCDAVGELYDAFTARGADAAYGRTSTEGYAAVESKALAPPGTENDGARWLGCLFDEVNQSDQSEDRAARWVAQLREEGFFAD